MDRKLLQTSVGPLGLTLGVIIIMNSDHFWLTALGVLLAVYGGFFLGQFDGERKARQEHSTKSSDLTDHD